jgi:protein tyrosine phosphatase (PTP) superfamily phosphohydrolase (DUF442 family)
VVGYQAFWVVVGPNLHQVLPGEVHRSATLDPASLRAYCQRHGVRTVINLRGCCLDAEWYHVQTQTLEQIGVEQRDVNLSSYSLPTVPELRKLVQSLEHCRTPVLLHCRRGADRTGLASALVLLLYTEATLEEARRQLSWRFGHIGLNRTSSLRTLFDMYEEALAARGERHSPDRLRNWLMNEYRPRHLWADLEPLEVPSRLPVGRPVAARFRVTNSSAYPWHFRQASRASVYLRCCLTKPESITELEGGAGLFDHTLMPGESLELTLALPAVREPGRYRLVVGMSDRELSWFHLYGSPKFETELSVGDE